MRCIALIVLVLALAACGSNSSTSSGGASTANGYYQAGEAFAKWRDASTPYVPGSSLGGADNSTPITPEGWCVYIGGLALIGGPGAPAGTAPPPAPDPGQLSIGATPPAGSPEGAWVAGCTAYIAAKYGS